MRAPAMVQPAQSLGCCQVSAGKASMSARNARFRSPIAWWIAEVSIRFSSHRPGHVLSFGACRAGESARWGGRGTSGQPPLTRAGVAATLAPPLTLGREYHLPMRPFRFGANVRAADSRATWIEKARRLEALGYSTLLVPDHLSEMLL